MPPEKLPHNVGTDTPLTTPVAFFIFSRPHTTQRVFAAIRDAKPKQLLVIADGPRNDAEVKLCQATRDVIAGVDWDCTVTTNYSDTNQGCRQRIASGLDWVFEHVEEAIILEDDCLPEPTFFRYCQELLERYRTDTKVMQIAGANFQHGNTHFQPTESYYFSTIPEIWGWATWRRAWNLYDVTMRVWPDVREKKLLHELLDDPAVADYWECIFENIYQNKTRKTNTWDAQWVLNSFINHGLSIEPAVNLIRNIGFGDGATRSTQTEDRNANLTTQPMEFPLRHPAYIIPDRNADAYSYHEGFRINKRLKDKIRSRVKHAMPSVYKKIKRLKDVLKKTRA